MTGRTQHLDADDITRRAADLHIWGFPYVFAQRLRWRFNEPPLWLLARLFWLTFRPY